MNPPSPTLLSPGSREHVPGRQGGARRGRADRWAATARWTCLALMAVGGAARLAQYLSGRSLFLDEAFLWLNLSRRSPGELLGRLDYAQGAPLPFLEGEKLLMAGLGDAEWALRLIPLLCGLVALPLAYLVARRCLRPLEVPVAVGLVALAPPLIYYSAEAKQYSLDVAVALALWLGGLCVARARLTAARAGALTAAGAAALWLSDPAVFVVAGVGGTLLVAAVLRRDRRRALYLAGAGAVWLASFAALYVVHVSNLEVVRTLATDRVGSAAGGGVLDSARGAVAGVPDPVGLPDWTAPALIALMLVGAWSMWRRGSGPTLALLSAPAAVTGLAALMHRYPLGLRFDLFLAPWIALLAAAGVGAVWTVARARAPWAGPALAAAVLALPAIGAVGVLVSPIDHEEIDQVLAQVAARRAPGDVVYVHFATQYAFAYAGPRHGFAVTPYDPRHPPSGAARTPEWHGAYPPALVSRPGLVIGRWSPDPATRARDVDRVPRGARVWFVSSHRDLDDDGVDERDPPLRRLEARGRVLERIDAPGAFAVLVAER